MYIDDNEYEQLQIKSAKVDELEQKINNMEWMQEKVMFIFYMIAFAILVLFITFSESLDFIPLQNYKGSLLILPLGFIKIICIIPIAIGIVGFNITIPSYILAKIFDKFANKSLKKDRFNFQAIKLYLIVALLIVLISVFALYFSGIK